MIHIDPDARTTTADTTHRDSTNELPLYTASSTVPIIFRPKSTDTTYTSPKIYPSHILSSLSAPSTPPSVFSSRSPPGFPFDTSQVEHNPIPSESSQFTLPPG